MPAEKRSHDATDLPDADEVELVLKRVTAGIKILEQRSCSTLKFVLIGHLWLATSTHNALIQSSQIKRLWNFYGIASSTLRSANVLRINTINYRKVQR